MPKAMRSFDVGNLRAHLETFGFVVLEGAIDAGALALELDAALADSGAAAIGVETGGGATAVQYVPMMCARTPRSLSLLTELGPLATGLLGRPSLALRAKGMRYAGSTPWHVDSTRAAVSLGFLAYLEPLDASNGALRVVPGSHRGDFREAALGYLAAAGPEAPAASLPGVALATAPGDVVVMDERLLHASAGGRKRRQWRVDFVADPTTREEDAALHALLDQTFPPDWDGGYDADAFPSFGDDWRRAVGSIAERLDAFGATTRAHAQEAFMRRARGADGGVGRRPR